MKYEIGHIYVIWDCEDHNLIYYGSTQQIFEERMKRHKARNNKCSSKQIIERGNYEYAILETHENIDEYDLVERERWYILNKVCVNQVVPHRTKAEWYQDNKEKIAKHRKEYRQDNKEKIAEYYQDNKEKLVKQRKVYCQNNKEKIAKQSKEYHQNNKEKIKEQVAGYYQNNKDELNEKNSKYYQKHKDKYSQKVRCPYCDKEMNKSSLLNHIKKSCKGQVTHQS